MGRLPKNGVDYFPHDVNAVHNCTLYIIQASYGNDGYAFWFKLLEYLGTQKELYADFSVKKNWKYFLSLANVSEEKGEAIMETLATLDAIDRELWEQQRIVWSENFVSRLSAVFKKRDIPTPIRPRLEGKGETESPPNPEEPEKRTAAEEKKTKKKYAEFVSMKEYEYQSLISRLGESATAKCIEVLDNYKGSTGKTYKSDYRTILNWVVDKVKKEHPELFVKVGASTATDDGNPFEEFGDDDE